jgi:hypothetical protein
MFSLSFRAHSAESYILCKYCADRIANEVITCGRCRKRNYQVSILFWRK